MAHETRSFLRAGMLVLAWSVPAALVYTMILVMPRNLPWIVREVWLEALVAYAAMALFLVATAPKVASACIRSQLITAIYFVGLFLVGVVAGILSSLWIVPPSPPETDRLRNDVLPMIKWIAIFGFLPAFFLGAAGHSILTKLVVSESKSPA